MSVKIMRTNRRTKSRMDEKKEVKKERTWKESMN